MNEQPNFAAAFDAFFRFKIGDHAICRTTAAAIALEAEAVGRVARYERLNVQLGCIILERLVQQCHGGFQGFYLVRRWTTEGQEVMAKFTDHELVPWSEHADTIRTMAPEKKD